MDENAWPLVRTAAYPPLMRGRVPDTDVILSVHIGSAGLLLLDYASWFHENIQPLDKGIPDDWGWAFKPNANNPGQYSRHARAIAIDLNAIQHPNGKPNTFPIVTQAKIKLKLATRYRGTLRSGVFYQHTKDDMHVEIDKTLPECEKVARRLINTSRGKRVCEANPGLRAAVLS